MQSSFHLGYDFIQSNGFISVSCPVMSAVNMIADMSGLTTLGAMKILIESLYHYSIFSGVLYRGKWYLELPHKATSRCRDYTPDEIKHLGCDSTSSDDTTCHLFNNPDFPCFGALSSELSYIIQWREYYPMSMEHSVKALGGVWSKDLDTYLRKTLYKNMTDIVALNATIVVANKDGWNDNHIGSNHCRIRLPYRNSIWYKSPSVRQLLDIIYSVNSHKFDKVYERYKECFISIKMGVLRITLRFEQDAC